MNISCQRQKPHKLKKEFSSYFSFRQRETKILLKEFLVSQISCLLEVDWMILLPKPSLNKEFQKNKVSYFLSKGDESERDS